jgi:hypothetical protein
MTFVSQPAHMLLQIVLIQTRVWIQPWQCLIDFQ